MPANWPWARCSELWQTLCQQSNYENDAQAATSQLHLRHRTEFLKKETIPHNWPVKPSSLNLELISDPAPLFSSIFEIVAYFISFVSLKSVKKLFLFEISSQVYAEIQQCKQIHKQMTYEPVIFDESKIYSMIRIVWFTNNCLLTAISFQWTKNIQHWPW